MSPYRITFVAAAFAIAGCEPTSRPTARPAPSLPFVEVTPSARDLLLRVAADQKLGPD
jgi:hypothetical protein